MQTAENARKLEEDELKLKINFQKHREEAERTIVQSLRLCKIEEISFNQYVSDFITLIESESYDVESMYIVKDLYEQMKVQFVRCKDLHNKHVCTLDRDPNGEEMEWVTSLQALLAEVNVNV